MPPSLILLSRIECEHHQKNPSSLGGTLAYNCVAQFEPFQHENSSYGTTLRLRMEQIRDEVPAIAFVANWSA